MIGTNFHGLPSGVIRLPDELITKKYICARGIQILSFTEYSLNNLKSTFGIFFMLNLLIFSNFHSPKFTFESPLDFTPCIFFVYDQMFLPIRCDFYSKNEPFTSNFLLLFCCKNSLEFDAFSLFSNNF